MTKRVLGKKQKDRYTNILANKGKDAAAQYRQGIAARTTPATTPEPKPDGYVDQTSRIMAKPQRARYDAIRANKGKDAAAQYRQGLVSGQGGTGTSGTKTTYRNDAGEEVGRVLGKQQRQRYNAILANKGKGAAKAYRDTIIGKKGLTSDTPQEEAPVQEGPPVPNQDIPTGDEPGADTVDTNMGRMFPGMTMQLPENYEGSPLYQWQLGQGQKALDRRLSALGLRGSGAELEANSQLAAQLGGQESERLSGISQIEADRLERLLESESGRKERFGNSMWDRTMGLMDRGLSQNPGKHGFDAAGQIANYRATLGQLAGRGGGGGGGGGGGSGYNPYGGPMPQPDYGAVNSLSPWFDAANSSNWIGAVLPHLQ